MIKLMNRAFNCHFQDRLLLCIRLGLVGVLMLSNEHASSQVKSSKELKEARISRATNELKFGLPIDCILGKECYILAYVDHDPGPGFQDFGGGRQTYDGHDGTDFGVADEAAMKKGVAVKAAASGMVVRVRDGVVDDRIKRPQEAKHVRSIGCGNSVIIDHPGQWRTYYCHLRNGSLTVKPGIRVEKGAILGMVGSSGLASFPHVHFGVVHQGEAIDPFREHRKAQDDQPESYSLWEEAISYVPTGMISAGFSNQKTDINTVWEGSASLSSLTIKTAAIVFWVHPFGVIAGDVEQLRLVAPDGKIVRESTAAISSPNRINKVSLIGIRSTRDAPISAGTWQGQYQLRRNKELLIDVLREIEVEKN